MAEDYMSYHPDPYVRNYSDRGMAKWLGFYLSEHTSEMEKDSYTHNLVWQRRAELSEEIIAERLAQAFLERKQVIIQLATLDDEGHPFPDLIGTIEGSQDDKIYLCQPAGNLELLASDSIKYVEILSPEKWSELKR